MFQTIKNMIILLSISAILAGCFPLIDSHDHGYDHHNHEHYDHR